MDALLALHPNITVTGATSDQLAYLASHDSGTITVAGTLLSAPNTYLIETASTPSWTVTNGMVASVIDAAGAQTIHIASGGKLNLIGSDGHNVIVFDAYASTGLTEVHSGGTVIFKSGSTQIASIATSGDATNAPSQTIVFSNGSHELTNDGTTITLVGVGTISTVEGIV